MAFLILLLLRLLPVGVIIFIRREAVPVWAVVLAILVSIGMVVIGMAVDNLRASHYANEYHPQVTDPIRKRLQRLVPLRLGSWLLYGIALILVAVL